MKVIRVFIAHVKVRLQDWLDRKLQPPMVQTIISMRKDPTCKRPYCNKRGVRTDVRLGKVMGGGKVYCNCVIVETVEKNRVNRWRLWFGLERVA